MGRRGEKEGVGRRKTAATKSGESNIQRASYAKNRSTFDLTQQLRVRHLFKHSKSSKIDNEKGHLQNYAVFQFCGLACVKYSNY